MNSASVPVRFLAVFLPVAALLGVVLGLFYYQETSSQRDLIETETSANVPRLAEVIRGYLRLVVSDVMFLSEVKELQQMLESGGAGWREE